MPVARPPTARSNESSEQSSSSAGDHPSPGASCQSSAALPGISLATLSLQRRASPHRATDRRPHSVADAHRSAEDEAAMTEIRRYISEAVQASAPCRDRDSAPGRASRGVAVQTLMPVWDRLVWETNGACPRSRPTRRCGFRRFWPPDSAGFWPPDSARNWLPAPRVLATL